VTLHRQTGYPQFLSSSRHITQGGIDLQHVEWNDEAHALEGTVSVVRNNRTRIIIAVPASFSPVAATGGKMSVLEDGKIIGLDITPERTEDRRWSVSFRQE
jgi:hypothetical protein